MINSVINLYFQANDVRTIGLNSPGSNIPCNLFVNSTFANGTGAAQADVLWQSNGPRVFASSTDVLNLYGVLLDSYGTLVNAIAIKAWAFSNLSTTNAIVVGGGSNPMTTLLNSTGTLTIPPGAWVAGTTPDPTGWAVTPTTACNLTVTGTVGQSYEVAFLIV